MAPRVRRPSRDLWTAPSTIRIGPGVGSTGSRREHMYTRPSSPQSIGGVLDDAVRLYRESFLKTLPLSVAASVAISLPAMLLPRVPCQPGPQSLQAMMRIASSPTYWLTYLVGLLAYAVIYAALIVIINDIGFRPAGRPAGRAAGRLGAAAEHDRSVHPDWPDGRSRPHGAGHSRHLSLGHLPAHGLSVDPRQGTGRRLAQREPPAHQRTLVARDHHRHGGHHHGDRARDGS